MKGAQELQAQLHGGLLRQDHFSTGETYVNFLTEEEGDERIRAAYGKNYGRLVDVKTAWDPGNLFSANKNITPRSR
jgi:FAD/FMN-containing dehydrogenase